MKHIYVKLYFFTFLILYFKTSKCACDCTCCCKKKQNTNSSNEIQLSNTNIDTKSNLINKNITETNTKINTKTNKTKNITETNKTKNINLENNNKLNNKKNINENINSEDNNKKNINKTNQELKNNKTNPNALKNNHTNVDINVYNKNNNTNNNSNNKSKQITNEYNNVNIDPVMNPPVMNHPMMNPIMNNINNMNPMMNNMMMNNINNMNPMMNNMMMNNMNNMNHMMNPMGNPMMINNINNINPIEEAKKQNITNTHANGLQNIGATCYMNATLQCLAHIKKFTYYLLSHKANIQTNRYQNKLSYAFVEVLENLWQKNSITYYAPNNFKNLISQMNPLFAGIQANDSKDLVLFMLETMHNELNSAKKCNNNDNNGIINQYNYDESLQSFTKFFQENYKSIVSDIFYGMYNSRIKCHNCNIISHNIQCNNILIMPLEEVRKFKNRNENHVTIRECFEYYQKSDFMVGDNQIFCNNCKNESTSENNTTLIVGPKVLIINLNRGKGLQYDIKLSFDEYLDISDFIYYKETNVKYKLIGVVTHFGPSGNSGHFIAFCKSFVDGNWYKYNDAIVNLSSFKETQDTGVPYILFYEAI